MLAQVMAAGQVRLDPSWRSPLCRLSFLVADRKGNGFRGIHYHLHGRWYFRVRQHVSEFDR